MSSKTKNDTITFEKAVKVISPSSNPHKLYKLLTVVRKSVEWPRNKRNILKIHKSGLIKKLLTCLTSTHSNIVAVSLSILGNCCLEANCSHEVAFVGLSDLHNLLQRCSKNDGVNGRVFRILGNIGQHYMADYILKNKSHLLTYILNFIQNYVDNGDSQFSEATLLMAVRVVSKFLNRNLYPTLVDKFQILKPIGALFIKCSLKWIENKEGKAVLEQIIKFLYMFSKYKYQPGISQLRNTSEGDCFSYFSRILPLAPQTIVNTVMNFIPVSILKSDLPITEITDSFVKLLKEGSLEREDIKKEHKDYIKCLCFLLDAPINRDPIRCDDTIPQLIRTFRDIPNANNDMPEEGNKSFRNVAKRIIRFFFWFLVPIYTLDFLKNIETLCLILETFERCAYQQNLLKLQLRHGIIEVIIDKMELLLGNRHILKMKHKFQKKKIEREYFVSTRSHSWEPLPDSSDEEIDFPTMSLPSFRPSSPSSGSESDMMTSPWASPRTPTPPAESYTYHLEESDSEDYSPVCSETEDDDNDNSSPNFTQIGMEDWVESEEKSYTNNIMENTEKISEQDLKYRLIHHSLSLLRIYSNMQPLPSNMCLDSLIMILVKCCCYFDQNSRATTVAKYIIIKILSVHEFLIPLMQTNVIFDVFSLCTTEHGYDCAVCCHFQHIGDQIIDKFGDLIESGVGSGDIANRLICGDDDIKRQLAMAVPYIARCRNTLRNLMVNCKGIKILIDSLKDKNYRRKCLEVICVLEMKHLNFNSPLQWGLFKKKMFIGNYEISEDCKNVVTFVLDDNSCLSADRDALCEKSFFFEKLLNGSFKESNQEYVKLKETNYYSLKCLMYLLNCDLDMTEPKDIQLETHILLDMITLCHRYLLEELCLYLTICVKQFCLSPKNVPVIYKWSLESHTNILRLETVTYALKEVSNQHEKKDMIMKLFDLGFTEILIEDIEKLIANYIAPCHPKI